MFKIVPTKDPDSLAAAKSHAFKLLSRRWYSQAELMQRLQQKGFDTNVCKNTVELLKEYGYVDDTQLAAREVERCLHEKKLGPKRLQLRLQQRGIAPEIIGQVMSSISMESVQQLCVEETKRKLASLPPDLDNYKKRARLGAFLLRRGF